MNFLQGMEYEKAVKNIRSHLSEYITQFKLGALIIGISGGIDSSLSAALARPVCDELSIPLIGRSITIESNTSDEILRSKAVGDEFCTDFALIDLTMRYNEMKTILEPEHGPAESEQQAKIRLGNAKARIRMIYLYNLAQRNRGLVLSTDNYTELLLGFWTLHGDVGDYGMIQNLWKTEVYGMAQYLADSEIKNTSQKAAIYSCIDATPTDGLGISNSDLDQLGASSYAEVDEILREYLTTGKNTSHPVIQRHLGSEFKRNNPVNISRYDILAN
ncbi:MAG: NAD(+) synthase [Candidatus Electrothrix sp. LOE1_4_5]|nr:NAD(+) synthase [Candidatus Electrothrix gigas]